MTISEYLLSGLPKTTSAQEFLIELGKRYQLSNNVEFGYLMKQLMDMRYDNLGHMGQGIFRLGLCHGFSVWFGCELFLE